MTRPERDPATTPAPQVKQPHWLTVLTLLAAGLALAGLVSYLGATTLGG